MRVVHCPIEDNIGRTREDDSENKEKYCNYLATGTLVVISLLLTLGAFKSVCYAVYRNKVSFILIAFIFQTRAVTAIL